MNTTGKYREDIREYILGLVAEGVLDKDALIAEFVRWMNRKELNEFADLALCILDNAEENAE